MDQIHHHEHDHADVSAVAEDFAPLAALPSGFVPRVTTISAEEIAHANRPSTQMALAMAATGRRFYEGTADPVVVARRRAANRRARAARRAHRKGSR